MDSVRERLIDNRLSLYLRKAEYILFGAKYKFANWKVSKYDVKRIYYNVK